MFTSWFTVWWLLGLTLVTQPALVPALPVPNNSGAPSEFPDMPGAFPKDLTHTEPELPSSSTNAQPTNDPLQPSMGATEAAAQGWGQYLSTVNRLISGGSNAAPETPDTSTTSPSSSPTQVTVAPVTLSHLGANPGLNNDFEGFPVQAKLVPVLAAASSFPQPSSRWNRYYQSVQEKSYLPNWLKSALVYPVPKQHRY
ncbi:hypothetical protein H4R35_000922 [Dimargaris xerosporica]|nr:hypothetical protein H4R35_000922 [Dimargaris xerosporica]